MKRFASSFVIDEETQKEREEMSPQPQRVPSHFTTWQITVLMAIRDAIRANRRVFSNSLRSDVSSVKDMFRHAFRAFDLDGNGRIDLNEFRVVLERLDIRLSPHQTRDFLRTLDRNGDGTIDCEEFLNTLEMQLDRLPPTKTRMSPKRRGTYWGMLLHFTLLIVCMMTRDPNITVTMKGTYEMSPDQKFCTDNDDDDQDNLKKNVSAASSVTSSVSNKLVEESTALVKVQETFDNVLESLGQRLKDMVIQEENLKSEVMSVSSSSKHSTQSHRRRRLRKSRKEQLKTTVVDRTRLLRLADINNRRFRYMFSGALCKDQENATLNASSVVQKIEEHITDMIIEDVSKEFYEIIDGVVHGITDSM